MPTFERSHTISLFRNPDTGKGQSAPYVVPTLTHGALRSIVVSGAGTKTDNNDGNYTFAGHRHSQKRFSDFELATTIAPAANTKQGWLDHTQGIYPIQTAQDFNANAANGGATMVLTGAPTRSGKYLKRQVTQAIADADVSYRLRNFNLVDNVGLKNKFRVSFWEYVPAVATTGKFFRAYWNYDAAYPKSWNYYAGMQLQSYPASVATKSAASNSLTNGQSTTVTLTYPYSVSGLYLVDVNVGSNTKTNLVKINDTQYTFTFTAVGTVSNVTAAISIPSDAVKPQVAFTPVAGYRSTFRIEGTGDGQSTGYGEQTFPVVTGWQFWEFFFDFANDSYATVVNGKLLTDPARSYTGWIDGQLGPSKVLQYALLGNTIDPRAERDEMCAWALPSVDWDFRRVVICDSSDWSSTTKKFFECPTTSFVNDNIEFIVNQGDFSDLTGKHIFYVDGTTATYKGVLA